ncbi:MAG: glycosyltransferase, partial [Methanobacteriota archaeon]
MVEAGKILGAQIAASNLSEMTSLLISKAKASSSLFVCIANVHMVTTAVKHRGLRRAMNDSFVNTSDGMPLVWVLRLQGFKNAERVSGPDLMMAICEHAQIEQIPVYFYGGAPSVIESMKKKLKLHFPDLIIAGLESPPMLPEQPEIDVKVIERIKSSGAKIVFVGLGCPKQELWMHAYSPHIPAVLIGVGAAFDFFAGTVKRAPLWMQKSGLEWFYRLCSE